MTDRAANRECELESEPVQCHPAVFPLCSPFRCLSSRSGRAIGQNHRRLDFVSVLSPWSRSPRGAKITMAGQLIGIEGSGMIGCLDRGRFLHGVGFNGSFSESASLFMRSESAARLIEKSTNNRARSVR